MNLEEHLKNKAIKAKEKTEILGQLLLEKKLPTDQLITYADKAKDAEKAICIEALEYASRQHPAIADENMLKFVTQTLTSKAPRVKWESAKVIGNIAQLFPNQLEQSIAHLLINTEHSGTVVRWSSAFALGEILKMKTKHNAELLPAAEAICKREEKNSIRKIYQAAFKKLKQ